MKDSNEVKAVGLILGPPLRPWISPERAWTPLFPSSLDAKEEFSRGIEGLFSDSFSPFEDQSSSLKAPF